MRLFESAKDKMVEWNRFGNWVARHHGKYYYQYYRWGVETITREKMEKVVEPSSEIETLFLPKIEHLKNNTIIGLQVRWGNHLPGERDIFPTSPWQFCTLLDTMWHQWENPVLFIASDVIDLVIPHFEKYEPITVKSLGLTLDEHQIFADYWMLSKCNKLIGSNSTFFWVACLAAKNCDFFMRPDDTSRLVMFDPWDSSPCVILNSKYVEANIKEFENIDTGRKKHTKIVLPSNNRGKVERNTKPQWIDIPIKWSPKNGGENGK